MFCYPVIYDFSPDRTGWAQRWGNRGTRPGPEAPRRGGGAWLSQTKDREQLPAASPAPQGGLTPPAPEDTYSLSPQRSGGPEEGRRKSGTSAAETEGRVPTYLPPPGPPGGYGETGGGEARRGAASSARRVPYSGGRSSRRRVGTAKTHLTADTPHRRSHPDSLRAYLAFMTSPAGVLPRANEAAGLDGSANRLSQGRGSQYRQGWCHLLWSLRREAAERAWKDPDAALRRRQRCARHRRGRRVSWDTQSLGYAPGEVRWRVFPLLTFHIIKKLFLFCFI